MPKSVSNLIMRNVLQQLKSDGVNTKSIIEYCGVSDYEIERDNGRIAEHKHYRFMLKIKEYIQPVNDFIFDNFMAFSFHNHPDFIGICLNESSAKEALDSYIRYRVMIGNCDDLIKHTGTEKSSFEYINLGPKELGASLAIFNFIMLYSVVKNYSDFSTLTSGSLASRHRENIYWMHFLIPNVYGSKIATILFLITKN